MNKIRFIGDVHGKYKQYAKICKSANINTHTVQIGDMGFSYGHFKHFELHYSRHVFFGGNHENYDKYEECENALGDFGNVELPGCQPFFIVRGAYSIDHSLRTVGIDWWWQEELPYKKMADAIANYETVKPDLMVTHDCPNVMRDWFCDNGKSLLGNMKIPTATGNALGAMFDLHKPKTWIFGHWHNDTEVEIEGCRFICLDELSYMDV